MFPPLIHTCRSYTVTACTIISLHEFTTRFPIPIQLFPFILNIAQILHKMILRWIWHGFSPIFQKIISHDNPNYVFLK